MFSFKDIFGQRPSKPLRRVPGNMWKRILRSRGVSVSRGFTLTRPGTQEYKRIIAASKTKGWSRNPSYGSKDHLKRLKKLIVDARIRDLKSRGVRAV